MKVEFHEFTLIFMKINNNNLLLSFIALSPVKICLTWKTNKCDVKANVIIFDVESKFAKEE